MPAIAILIVVCPVFGTGGGVFDFGRERGWGVGSFKSTFFSNLKMHCGLSHSSTLSDPPKKCQIHSSSFKGVSSTMKHTQDILKNTKEKRGFRILELLALNTIFFSI